MKTEITRGTVVMIKGGRFNCHAVVASSRYVSKGRQAGTYECKLGLFEIGRNGKPVYVTANARYLYPATKQFSAAQIAKAIDSVEQIKKTRAENETKRDERNAEAMRKIECQLRQSTGARAFIESGDEVLIRYSDIGDRWERVRDCRSGKVGIEKRNLGAIKAYNERARQTADVFEDLGLTRRARTKRELRWLPATMVKDVRKAAGNVGKSADAISIDAAQLVSALNALSSAQEAALATA